MANTRFLTTNDNGLDDLDEFEEAVAPRITPAQKHVQAKTRQLLFEQGSSFRPTRRDEIVGIDNVLGEIDEIIHWLCHADLYSEYNSRLQPGVVFSGDPGTGKTLVSRWIATAADALFINVREFPLPGALPTAADVRELWRYGREARARLGKPVIFFLDEFETWAVERSGERTTPEQGSVVSQLTEELDGIHGKNEGLLFIGCTNYPTLIDRALTRSGRMGVHIEYHAPDRAGKEKILRYYLQGMATTGDIDTHTLSFFFPRHTTAANIEEACVEAWRGAVRRSIVGGAGGPVLGQEDLIDVFVKQLVGPPTTFVVPDKERVDLAIHECGHAISALTYRVPLLLITVQPGKESLGKVVVDETREYAGSVDDVLDSMKVGLGGMAAEVVAGLRPATGSASDADKVTAAAEFLVGRLGQGLRTGLFNYGALERACGYSLLDPQISAETVTHADYDVKDLVTEAKHAALVAMERVGRDKLVEIAAIINERVTLTGTQFRELYIDVCGFEPELEV